MSRTTGKAFGRFSCFDFNDHLAAIGQQTSNLIYFLNLDSPNGNYPAFTTQNTARVPLMPAFSNVGNVSAVFTDEEKVIVGCQDIPSLHVWDFSCKTKWQV